MQWFLGGLAAVPLLGVFTDRTKGGKAACYTVCFVASLLALVITR